MYEYASCFLITGLDMHVLFEKLIVILINS